jgi:site-specific recombinase XerD
MKLGKSSDSRTRGRARTAVGSEEAQRLKARLKEADVLRSAGPIEDYVDHLLSKGYSGSTTERYVRDSLRFMQWAEQQNVGIQQVGYADILHYVQGMRGKVKQRSISTTVNSLRHWFDHLVSSGEASENPTRQVAIKGVQRKHLYDILNRQQLDKLYHEHTWIEDEKLKKQNWYQASALTHQRNKAIVGLLVFQGLNVMEIARLEEKDLKLREGRVYIAATRRSNERELTLEAAQILDLMEYQLKARPALLELTRKASDRLIVSTGSGQGINNAMFKLTEKLHQQDPSVKSMKQIRTSVITHWLKLYNLREVQHMAGHRYVSSTEAYRINDLDELQEDIGKFHPIG